jgi:hypothetical protein
MCIAGTTDSRIRSSILDSFPPGSSQLVPHALPRFVVYRFSSTRRLHVVAYLFDHKITVLMRARKYVDINIKLNFARTREALRNPKKPIVLPVLVESR